jgi:hypothetical protein
MDWNTAAERACPAEFRIIGEEASPSPRSECRAALRVSRGEALIWCCCCHSGFGRRPGGCRLGGHGLAVVTLGRTVGRWLINPGLIRAGSRRRPAQLRFVEIELKGFDAVQIRR